MTTTPSQNADLKFIFGIEAIFAVLFIIGTILMRLELISWGSLLAYHLLATLCVGLGSGMAFYIWGPLQKGLGRVACCWLLTLVAGSITYFTLGI